MPEYLSPGVYVEEVDSGPKPIVGVSTTTAGMVGVTYQGPVDIPTLVVGFADYKQKFGGYLDRRAYPNGTWYLPHAVEAFFTNGGKRAYIVRVLPPTATVASLNLFDRGPGDGANTQLAIRAGGNSTAIVVDTNAGINPNDWLRIDDGAFTEYVQAAAATARGIRAIRTPLRFNHPAGVASPVVSVTIATAAGTKLSADLFPGETSIQVKSRAGLAVGNLLQIGPPVAPTIVPAEYAIVAALPPDPTGQLVVLDGPLAFAHNGTTSPEDVLPATEAPGTASQLDQDAAAGQNVLLIQVTGGAGNYAAGSVIRVGGVADPTREYHIIAATQASGGDTVPIAYSLFHGVSKVHPALDVIQTVTLAAATGTAVFDQTLQTTALPGSTSLNLVSLSPGTGNNALAANDLLQIGAGATQENVTLAITPWDTTSTVVQLSQPLVFMHNPGEHAVRMGTPAADPTKTTTLLQGLSAGDTQLLVADTLTAGLVQIGPPASASVEYRVLGPENAVAPLSIAGGLGTGGGLLYDHTHGAGVLGRSRELLVQAIDPGAWGNDLQITVEDSAPPYAKATAAADPNPASSQLTLSTTVGLEVGSVVNIGFSAGTAQRKVINVSGKVIKLSASHGSAVLAGALVTSQEFNLRADLVQVNPLTGKSRITQTETFHQLSMDPRHSRYAPKIIGPIFRSDATTPRGADGRTQGQATLIRVEDALANALGVLNPANLLIAENTIRVGPDIIVDQSDDGVALPLTGGDDDIGNVVDDTFIGQDDVNPQNRTGLFALKNIDQISQVGVPGQTSQVVQQAVIDHVEFMRYRFAVLDSIPGADLDIVSAQRGLYDSKYAALYYPWMMIEDPFPDNPRNPGQVSIPPSGAVLGIIARTDITRGVFKAPANELVEGIEDLEFKLMKEQQDILNPQNINVVRDFREQLRGIRVWGARNVSSDPDWLYVNVRRLFNFIEHSIDIGTQPFVFEPNDQFLWQRVTRSISGFLKTVWRDGGLMGAKPEDAYFVHVGNDTMTPDDLENGRLIVEVGIAPVYPAEFVIFRIGQWVGGSSVSEG
jgi:phage tail sheath protein FI